MILKIYLSYDLQDLVPIFDIKTQKMIILQKYYALPIIYNKMNKSLILLAIGSILAAAISFMKLTKYRKKQRQKKQKQKQKQQSKNEKIASTSTSLTTPKKQTIENQNNEQSSIRELFDCEVTQKNPFKLRAVKAQYCKQIQELSYKVLLNLNKSKVYEGVITIKLKSVKSLLNNENLYIDYRGGSILYVSINQQKIQQTKLIFKNSQICIEKQLLNPHENSIEIIFSNKYAFLGDGLACYFPLDEANKYSLKGQVIYTNNGLYKASKIFPCINVLNSCEMKLEVLHSNGFHVESNGYKILNKMVTKKDYPLYHFLFQIGLNSSLNSSRKLNNSGTSETSLRSSEDLVKIKSQFTVTKLNSIHDFFLFSSAVTEVKPLKNLSLSYRNVQELRNKANKEIMIRYFFKQHMLKKASSYLSILELQIEQILEKIEKYRNNIKSFGKMTGKVDIFFINDTESEGNFSMGAILLSEHSVQRGIVDSRLRYLLCRSFVGMAYLSKKSHHLLSIEDFSKLNQLTLDIFQECKDFVYVKNIQYEYLLIEWLSILQRKQKNTKKIDDKQALINEKMFWLTEYFQKQCKYVVKNMEKLCKEVTVNVQNISRNLFMMDSEQYWAYFFGKYSFIQFNVAEILIKISLQVHEVPKNSQEVNFARQYLIKSKHYLRFFTEKQIQSNIRRFLQLNSHDLERVLPFIKIKQSCLNLIPQRMQPFLPARENFYECEKLYEQFKKFNQQSNFHHKVALERQVNRICLFLKNQLKNEYRNINCDLSGWKMLSRLQIYPQDQENQKIIKWLSNIEKDHHQKIELRMQDSQNLFGMRKKEDKYEIDGTFAKIQQNQEIMRVRKDSEIRLQQQIQEMQRLLQSEPEYSNI